MNEITISLAEYQMLQKAFIEAEMLRNVFKKHIGVNETIFSDEVQTICTMLGIEAKQDA